MNRRNFFKGLCALAVAPLAAALPISRPKADCFMSVTGTRYVHDDLYKHIATATQNPEVVKELAVQGVRIDYKALIESLFDATSFPLDRDVIVPMRSTK